MPMADLSDLLSRVEQASGPDNRLDCDIDIALFEPDSEHASVRMNAARTKLVYTRHDGRTDTYWAQDHTLNATRRALACERLRALIAKDTNNG